MLSIIKKTTRGLLLESDLQREFFFCLGAGEACVKQANNPRWTLGVRSAAPFESGGFRADLWRSAAPFIPGVSWPVLNVKKLSSISPPAFIHGMRAGPTAARG